MADFRERLCDHEAVKERAQLLGPLRCTEEDVAIEQGNLGAMLRQGSERKVEKAFFLP